jgi:adenosylcobinamide-phosphate synthase
MLQVICKYDIDFKTINQLIDANMFSSVPDHALLAVSALALNAVVAGPRRVLMQVGLLELAHRPAKYARILERKLNRDHRSPSERMMRGSVLCFAAVFASIIFGALLSWIFQYNMRFLELLLLIAALPVRATWDIASGVRQGLHVNDLSYARASFTGTQIKHHALLDSHGLARCAIELVAANFAIKILSPIMWYVFFGLSGLFISLSATLLLEASPGDDDFSKPLRSFNSLVHFVPIRFAAFFWLGTSLFVPSLKTASTSQVMVLIYSGADMYRVSLAPVAYILKLSLGGPSSIYAKEWVGDGNPKPRAADIKRTLYLFALLHLFVLLLLGLAV